MVAATPLVRDFAARYLREVVAKDRKDPAPVARYLERDLLPSLGRRRVDRVSGHDLQRIVFARRDRGRPAAAMAIRAVARRMFEYAIVCGAARQNPADAVPRRYLGRQRARERTLSEAELARLLRTLDQAGNDRAAWALELLLLTGCRKGELRLARWQEIDLEEAVWEIPAARTKQHRAHVVYLSPRAVELFRRIRRGQHATVQAVLPMQAATLEPASEAWLNQRLRQLVTAAGLAHLTVHDLRRTAATQWTEMGWKPEVVEKALGHAIAGIRGVYNRAEFREERRQMLAAWADWLDTVRRRR